MPYIYISLLEKELLKLPPQKNTYISILSFLGGPLMLLLPTHLTMLWVSIQNVFFEDSNSHKQSSIWPCG